MSGMPGTSDTSQRDPVHSGGVSAGSGWIVVAAVLRFLMVGPLACLIGVGLLSSDTVARGAAVIRAVVVHGRELEAPS
jgi:hypothetical protein